MLVGCGSNGRRTLRNIFSACIINIFTLRQEAYTVAWKWNGSGNFLGRRHSLTIAILARQARDFFRHYVNKNEKI